MKCKLCTKEIKDYDARFHHFNIDDAHSADICTECVDKFIKWQGSVVSNLFPTKAMKKRYGKDK